MTDRTIHLPAVSKPEYDAILAGLRYWERTANNDDFEEFEIAADSGRALDDDEVAVLGDRLQEEESPLQAILQDAMSAWPQFDPASPRHDEEVNGGDLVDWFGGWLEKARAVLGGAAIPPAAPSTAPDRERIALALFASLTPWRTDNEERFAKAQRPDGGNTVGMSTINEVSKAFRDADTTIAAMNIAGDVAVTPAAPTSADTARLDWLQGRIVDTIYLDDGKIIDVRGDDLRKAIDLAKLQWPNSLEDDDGDEKSAAPDLSSAGQDERAAEEGWCLLETAGAGLAIHADTDSPIFCRAGTSHDDEAETFVRAKAAEGSAYHIAALARLGAATPASV